MVGAGAASKRGILVKSAMALETAGRATHVIFDKTGTLTTGSASVTDITPLGLGSADGTATADDVLRLAAAVESPSEHPIAKAIVREARSRGLSIPPVHGFEAIPGQGVRGNVEGRIVVVIRDDAATCRVEVDGRKLGTMMVSDHLRHDAKPAIARLQQMGLDVFLLSGDRRLVAESIGELLGLPKDKVIAEATPSSKSTFVAELSSKGPNTASRRDSTVMVGDGINDAAALAQADLGIAMAGGTNIAIESADVVIPGDRVMAVPQTIDIARQTLRTIKQNLFFAFFYNAAAIPAAALGLLGPFGPLFAAAAMGLSDITVIGNAIRLKRRLSKPPI
jgi:P-type E1-E2 ATPase